LVQYMSIESQMYVFAHARVNKPPSLHFPGPHPNSGKKQSINSNATHKTVRGSLIKRFNFSVFIKVDLLEDKYLFLRFGGLDLGNRVKSSISINSSFYNERATYAACNLYSCRTMIVGMIPKCPGRVIIGNVNFIVLRLTRMNCQENVVAIT